jgi:hypothetical protein
MDRIQTAFRPPPAKAAMLLVAVIVLTFFCVAEAKADNQISSSLPRVELGESQPLIGELAGQAGAAASYGSVSRSKKKRFMMPVSRAAGRTASFVRYMFNNSAPDEFSVELDPPTYWDRFDWGLCKRRSYTKVVCFSYLEADFNLIDENDQVVGSDTFVCGWDTAVWYPVARRPVLKWTTLNAGCFWESEV